MSCSSCHLDIRACTYIKCAECSVPPIQLCLPCFTGKFKTKRHSEHHDYYVIQTNCIYQPMITQHRFDDILMLLDTSRKFSVGSWDEMRTRSRLPLASHCEESFMKLYNCWVGIFGDQEMSSISSLDSTGIRNAILPNMAGLALTPFRGTALNSDLPGFMPSRVDFEVEYDDSAELVIADIEFGEEDSPDDYTTKIRCLHALNDRIRRREHVKQFVMDHRLVSTQVETSHHVCRSAEEVELRGKLRPIERHFPNVAEYEAFVQLLLAEARLVDKIGSYDNTLANPADSLADNEDVGEAKPSTRSRGNTDNSRRGKTADDECSRILDLLQREPNIFNPENDVPSIEKIALEKIGLGEIPFSAIRDQILEKIGPCDELVADLVVTRLEDIVTVRTSMRT